MKKLLITIAFVGLALASAAAHYLIGKIPVT